MEYIINHIPLKTPYDRRPQIPMNATTITIHNTANKTSTAKNERSWLTNPDNKRQASYHIVIDEWKAIECLPTNENAWHTGDGSGINSGNRTSIGIELTESGNYEKTVQNAVELVAKMLLERGWGIDRLRRHWDWGNKKICPRLMYDKGTWTTWYEFKKRVQECMKGGIALSNKPTVTKERVYASGSELKRIDGDYSISATDVRTITFPKGKYRLKFVNETNARVSDLVKKYKADYGFNLPYFDKEKKYIFGDLVIDRKVIKTSSEPLKTHFAFKNGEVVIGNNLNVNDGYDMLCQIKPMLINNGSLAYEYFRKNQDVLIDIANKEDTKRAQRTFVGVNNGDLILGIGDGRNPKYDRGLNLKEMSYFMRDKGAKFAANGDGGSSTVLCDKNGMLNSQTYEPIVHHAVLVFLIDDVNDESSHPKEEYDTYTVKSGDYLYKIGTEYDMTIDEIKTINNLSSNVINAGQKLKVKKKTIESPKPTPKPKPEPKPTPAPKPKPKPTTPENKSKYFNDIPDNLDWVIDAADRMVDKGIFSKPANRLLNPNDNATRAELLVVADRIIKFIEDNK
jgi:N-acetylmuramoyl-L-alanine amidase